MKKRLTRLIALSLSAILVLADASLITVLADDEVVLEEDSAIVEEAVVLDSEDVIIEEELESEVIIEEDSDILVEEVEEALTADVVAEDAAANEPSAKKYKITYKLNGGKNAKGNPASYVKSNKSIKLKDATRTGYKFNGWYTDARCSKSKRIKSIKAGTHKNLTLYASWIPISYVITYDANGGKGRLETRLVAYDQFIVLRNNNFSRDGYEFVGWSLNKSLANCGIPQFKSGMCIRKLTTTPGKIVRIYAVWRKL